MNFGFGNGRRRRSRGLATIFGERLAGEKNGFFRDRAGCGGSGCFGRAVIEAALCGTARFETTGLAAAIFLATIVAAAVILTSVFVAA